MAEPFGKSGGRASDAVRSFRLGKIDRRVNLVCELVRNGRIIDYEGRIVEYRKSGTLISAFTVNVV